MIPWLDPDAPPHHFPPVERALRHPNGLLCAGGDLGPERLVAAYARGLFPWYSEGEPILWWSPDPRMVFEPGRVHVSRRLARSIRSTSWCVTVNRAFEAVIRACAAPRPDQAGTWIDQRMIEAYVVLHRRGDAHSLEVWNGDDLVGGIYGVAIGRVFFGESMFHRASNASRMALVALAELLDRCGYRLLDGQVESTHLAQMGAFKLPRSEFLRIVESASQEEPTDKEHWHRLSRPVQLATFFASP